MRYKFTLIPFLLLFFCITMKGQNTWEIFAGYSKSNINDHLNGQNQVFNYPINSPNYLNTFHFGVANNFLKKDRYFLQVGLGFYGKGSKDFAHIIYPVDTVIEHHLYYLGLPVTANIKLLKSKKIYFSFGLIPGYLLKQSKLYNVRIFPTANYFQLDYKLGVRFNLIKKIDISTYYTQGLRKVSNSEFDVPNLNSRTINHSFDITLIYKL